MTTVLVVSHRTEATDRGRPWAALEVTLAALAAYGDGVGLRLVLGWEGPCPPPVPPELDAEVVELPPLLSDWESRVWLAENHVDAELVVLLADDAVIGPDTLPLLFDDAAEAIASGPTGLIAARCDASAGRQNPAAPAGPTELDRVDLTVAVTSREALRSIRPPEDDVVGDLIVSWDLGLLGGRNLVSRAVVHRPRPTGSVHIDGSDEVPAALVSRLHYHRPDLCEAVLATAGAATGTRPTPAMELEDPVRAAIEWRAQPDGVEARLGLARSLRQQGRTVEAADALGDLDPTSLDDTQLAAVAEMAWAVGDFASAIEVYASRPERFADARDEGIELVRRGVEHGDPHARAIAAIRGS